MHINIYLKKLMYWLMNACLISSCMNENYYFIQYDFFLGCNKSSLYGNNHFRKGKYYNIINRSNKHERVLLWSTVHYRVTISSNTCCKICDVYLVHILHYYYYQTSTAKRKTMTFEPPATQTDELFMQFKRQKVRGIKNESIL